MTAPAHRIDTIVVGGSAGSFGVLKTLLAELPTDLPATVLVCQHHSSVGAPRAVELLAPLSALPLREAAEGMPLEPGTAIFAAPDRHMMLGKDHVHLRRGAHENNFRPAIDPLFRSAAVYRGPRAVGVVLSGLMDDGAAGARALVRTGGRILVQSPGHADYPDMPRAALDAVPEAEAVPPEALAARIAALAGTPCEAPGKVPWQIGVELKIAGLEGATMENEERMGTLSPYNCPHCNGVLWEIEDGPMVRFRCHTGHGYTLRTLGAAQEEALDKGLFDALRAHKGRASLIRRMADTATGETSRRMFRDRARKVEEDAERLERIIRERAQV